MREEEEEREGGLYKNRRFLPNKTVLDVFVSQRYKSKEQAAFAYHNLSPVDKELVKKIL